MEFFNAWGLYLMLVSVSMFIISLVSTPHILARIPVDYFTHHGRHRSGESLRLTIAGMIVAGLKNVLGAILLLAGCIMLFTPGPGLVTILFGLMMMNFPGKYRLECWIISRPLILHRVNSMRAKQGQPPLQKTPITGPSAKGD